MFWGGLSFQRQGSRWLHATSAITRLRSLRIIGVPTRPTPNPLSKCNRDLSPIITQCATVTVFKPRKGGTIGAMDCPNCKLVNPPTAARCDCGYDFEMHTVRESYLTQRDRRLSRQSLGVAGAILGVLVLLESILRLTSVAVARHSLALGVLTALAVIVFVRVWFWNAKAAPGIGKLTSREIQTAWFCLFALLALCLLPWFYLFGLSGMVGDSGNPLSIRDYLFLAWIWTFPLTLAITLIFRRRVPALIFLPLLHAVSFIAWLTPIR
jgi:hypothetical protein